MKVLVIGSEGFIGNAMINQFAENGYEIIGCDLLDIKNSGYPYYRISRLNPEYHEIFQEEQNIDICVNAAGNGSIPHSIKYPLHDFEANCIDTFHILEALRKESPTTRYLYISSAAIYGNPKRLPVNETDPFDPVSPYGWHKYYGELLCQEYYKLHGLATTIIRPFSVYGPGLKKQLLWDIFLKSKKNDTIMLFGTGKETRDFIYIDDLVKATSLIFEAGKFEADVYNLANGIEVEIQYIARLAMRYIKHNGRVIFSGDYRKGDPLNWKANVKKIEAIGYRQSVSLEEGVKRTTAWQKDYGLV